MSILEYNGSGCVAMVGKDCIAIASDTRYGNKNVTVTKNMQKIFKIHDKLYLGLTGLATDIQTVYNKLRFRTNLYTLKEGREIPPSAFNNLVSSVLYERRFSPWFVEPLIIGLEGKDNKPYIAAQDLIGAVSYTDNFVVSGTCSEELYGMCESLWKKDMDDNQIFEVISQSLLASVDRDTFSGWGAIVHVVSSQKEGVRSVTRKLKVRQD